MSIHGIQGRPKEEYAPNEGESAVLASKNSNDELEALSREVQDKNIEAALSNKELRSYGELKADSVKDAGKAFAHEAVHHVVGEAGTKLAEKAAAKVAHVLGLATAVVATAYSGTKAALDLVDYYREKGATASRSLDVERLQVAVVTALRLPSGFQESELDRNKQGVAISTHGSFGNFMLKLHDNEHKGLVRELQFKADKGATAAFEMIAAGGNLEAYLEKNPGIGRSIVDDIGFRAGFNAAVWASGRGGDKAVKEFKEDIESRIVRPQTTILQRG